ncbi:hypothetical protein DSCO28_68480 [Desulfosarcina ovata subsp. sediminis]|uniref:Uncharacterized protein n=1 Tax=Desulfosarcina ovata subsp. sediminis TaxID=885957 RepID=A0A5K8A164_9BACT|nr:hypothetical protein DSCO28_68480 [Desulfosarcina ovata subsp. sediminis]
MRMIFKIKCAQNKEMLRYKKYIAIPFPDLWFYSELLIVLKFAIVKWTLCEGDNSYLTYNILSLKDNRPRPEFNGWEKLILVYILTIVFKIEMQF